MNASSPKISVALCTYNGERFLREQLASITEQTLHPTEVIASDDASTDGTPSILQDFAARAPFPVRVLRNERNLGTAQNFSRALGQCSGDYIALCDQDDVWLPTKLQKVVSALRPSPCANAVFTDGFVVEESGTQTGERLSSVFHFRTSAVRRRLQRDPLGVLIAGNVCTGATMAFTKELRDLALPLPQGLPKRVLHDGWIALVAAAMNALRYVDEPLILYRLHPFQQIGTEVKEPSLGLLDRIRRGQAERRALIADEAEQTQLIAAALRERLSRKANLALVESRAEHLRSRAQLPSRTGRRVVQILRETVRGRYFRYSDSFLLSQIHDLLT